MTAVDGARSDGRPPSGDTAGNTRPGLYLGGGQRGFREITLLATREQNGEVLVRAPVVGRNPLERSPRHGGEPADVMLYVPLPRGKGVLNAGQRQETEGGMEFGELAIQADVAGVVVRTGTRTPAGSGTGRPAPGSRLRASLPRLR